MSIEAEDPQFYKKIWHEIEDIFDALNNNEWLDIHYMGETVDSFECMHISNVGTELLAKYIKDLIIKDRELNQLMTGQEWYQRFEKELSNYRGRTEINSLEECYQELIKSRKYATQAAKKAAGL